MKVRTSNLKASQVLGIINGPPLHVSIHLSQLVQYTFQRTLLPYATVPVLRILNPEIHKETLSDAKCDGRKPSEQTQRYGNRNLSRAHTVAHMSPR